MAEVVRVLLHAEIAADPAVIVDDQIARGQFMELGGGRMGCAAPFLPPDAGSVGEFDIGDDDEVVQAVA